MSIQCENGHRYNCNPNTCIGRRCREGGHRGRHLRYSSDAQSIFNRNKLNFHYKTYNVKNQNSLKRGAQSQLELARMRTKYRSLSCLPNICDWPGGGLRNGRGIVYRRGRNLSTRTSQFHHGGRSGRIKGQRHTIPIIRFFLRKAIRWN